MLHKLRSWSLFYRERYIRLLLIWTLSYMPILIWIPKIFEKRRMCTVTNKHSWKFKSMLGGNDNEKIRCQNIFTIWLYHNFLSIKSWFKCHLFSWIDFIRIFLFFLIRENFVIGILNQENKSGNSNFIWLQIQIANKIRWKNDESRYGTSLTWAYFQFEMTNFALKAWNSPTLICHKYHFIFSNLPQWIPTKTSCKVPNKFTSVF